MQQTDLGSEMAVNVTPANPRKVLGAFGAGRARWTAGGVLLMVALAGCNSTRLSRAPVEDRGAGQPPISTPATSGVPAEAKPLPPGWENAGKPGYYSVKPGDTLMRIGLEHGQSWRDLVRWNNLTDPNKIEVGQVLRVQPPTADASVATTKPVPLPSTAPAAPTPLPPVAAAKPAASSPAAQPSAPAPAVPAATAPAAPGSDEDIDWFWPSNAKVIAGFDEAKNKGLDLVGKAGDPVYASADGIVVYAGNSLRGYGNLVILKHNNTFLSAYAHNQTLLVKEKESVRKGQKIAEMGSTDTDKVKLHFEIRRNGKPVDPAKYLPKR